MTCFFKKILIPVGVLAISLFISLGLLEFYLHISGYRKQFLTWEWVTDGQIYNLDKELIYSLREGGVNRDYDLYINQYGIKYHPQDYDEREVNSDDSIKIVVLGDSIVWGNTEYKETYPYLTNKLIKEKTNLSAIVLNAGVSGYGTDQQYQFLTKRILSKILPQVIVWNINLNDIQDNIGRPLFDLRDNQLYPIEGWKNGIFIQGLMSKYIYKTPLKKTLLVNLLLNKIENVNMYQLSFSKDEQKSWSLSKMALLFEKIKILAKEENIKLVFVISPSQRYVEKLNGWEQEKENFELIKQAIGSNVPIIDANKAFLDSQNYISELATQSSQVLVQNVEEPALFLHEAEMFEKGNWHPNGLGNLIMANIVQKEIVNWDR